MGKGRLVFSEKRVLRELVCFRDIERIELSAYSLRGNSVENAKKAVDEVKAKLAEQGREVFSVEIFEDPVGLIPLNSVTIIVRSPTNNELGALATTTAIIVIGSLLVTLGFIIYKTTKVVEPVVEKFGVKLMVLGGVVFAVPLLREARLLLAEGKKK